MKKYMLITSLAAAALVTAGCHKDYFVDRRFAPDRAELTDTPIPVSTQPAPIVNPEPTEPNLPGVLEPTIRGTWTYTVPPTVTRVERQTDQISQASLYYGRPAPGDTPFVVITIGPNQKSAAESDPDQYKVLSTRQYVLNGNIANEWTGHGDTGAAFCEIVLSTPGGSGDLCHAIAVAKNEDQRKLALQILASITWKQNPQ